MSGSPMVLTNNKDNQPVIRGETPATLGANVCGEGAFHEESVTQVYTTVSPASVNFLLAVLIGCIAAHKNSRLSSYHLSCRCGPAAQ